MGSGAETLLITTPDPGAGQDDRQLQHDGCQVPEGPPADRGARARTEGHSRQGHGQERQGVQTTPQRPESGEAGAGGIASLKTVGLIRHTSTSRWWGQEPRSCLAGCSSPTQWRGKLSSLMSKVFKNVECLQFTDA